ncbi:GABA permease [Actinomadura vinacea]|uniref:GABA permease n=1 Tax=Actinomadura vinacea TaxID=115336 RepID=A0ABP5VH37_9ACTN
MSPPPEKPLQPRHITMITLGGMLGAGLFVGSGAAINLVGPGILICYVLSGLLLILVMRMLAELAADNPNSGSFSTYAEQVFGQWAGSVVGWLYWWFWVVIIAFEASAGASIVHDWMPAVPQWTIALLLMAALTLTNLWSVRSYGEFEFWFAGIKVAAIIAFIAIGVIVLVGLFPGHPSPGLANLTGHGGFLPHGTGSIAKGMLIVFLTFIGPEMVSIAAAESDEPARAIRRTTNSIIWRILFFYTGSIGIAVTLLPWNSSGIGESPYVAVLDWTGFPSAGAVMAVVVLTAVLSCLNSGLYTASRMVFSLAERGQAPAALARLSGRRVPRPAILASVAVGFVGVIFNYLSPDRVFLFLLNSSSATALFVYIAIGVTQIVSRYRVRKRGTEQALTIRMWCFPWLSLLAVAAMVYIIVAMLADPSVRSQIVAALVVAAVFVAFSGLNRFRSGPRTTPGTGASPSAHPESGAEHVR